MNIIMLISEFLSLCRASVKNSLETHSVSTIISGNHDDYVFTCLSPDGSVKCVRSIR